MARRPRICSPTAKSTSARAPPSLDRARAQRPGGPLAYVQNRLAGEVAVDKPLSDGADLVPAGLDRDLRLQPTVRDFGREEREADAGALDAHQLVEQRQAVKPRAAGTKKAAALDIGTAR